MGWTATSGPRRVAVVGGGMLGARLAWLLADAGVAVTLYEAGPTLGGLVAPWQVGDLTWDRLYHVILLSDARTRALVEALGLGDRLRFGVTRTGFYTDGRQHSMSDALEFLRFPPLGLTDKLRLGGTIAAVARMPAGPWLERVPVLDFLTALSGRRTAERIWRPLLQAKLGDEHARAPAAFIHATIQRMYAAR
ncbi:MAG: NAD(P)-binding protein, partial [Myxococcales bacterium]|nr:NAD(P)-binding protein [Myxococcales bacterium]